MIYRKCACCGKETLEEGSKHDICSVCGWEDDNVQNNDPDYEGGANTISLNEAKRVFSQGITLRSYKKAAWLRRQEQKKHVTETLEPQAETIAEVAVLG